ncbi:MAG: ATP-dependent DNA helicase RecG, partial [Gracilibacteraceae bacterium]|nr:ATP-dependent DNA helicase RecG [Gracilibacteraceae bacterium]
SEPQRLRLRELCDAYGMASPAERRKLFREIEGLVMDSGAVLPAKPPAVDSGQVDRADKPVLDSGKSEEEESGGEADRIFERIERNNPKAQSEAQSTRTRDQLRQQTRVQTKKQTHNSAGVPDLQYIRGVGPYRLKLLGSLGVNTVEQLLRYFPRRYEHVTARRIEDLRDGELAVVEGTVAEAYVGSGRVKVIRLSIIQDFGPVQQALTPVQVRRIDAVWFNQIHIPKSFPAGTRVAVTGKVQWNKKVPEILVSDIEKIDISSEFRPVNEVSIVPVYAETAGLNSKAIRMIVGNATGYIEALFGEILPEQEPMTAIPRAEAYHQIHFPQDEESLRKARTRLIGEEALLLQLAFARFRAQPMEETAPALPGDAGELAAFRRELPFRLTQAQHKAIAEIAADLRRRTPMRRLLQGDVGSGKTVVAMMALFQAVTSGYQGTIMAPTEVLAQQHFQTLDAYFTPRGVCVRLLTGSQPKKERDEILAGIADGAVQVAVGTSALIQESVRFASLGVVVADEQHRFGVRQRTHLQDKGENPHVLVMTATPIPRTLALTVYGDLRLSVLDELPAGRKAIITRCVGSVGAKMYDFVDKQMQNGRQIYVVCPLVEETENSDFVSATERYEQLCERFPGRRVVLVHGRMKSQEKERVMGRFREGVIDMLVATTVVEVGVDVPNATVMIIENAEGFGLAQLHQLRGRVGRGGEQSYCFLVSRQRDASRLQILCETEDGFKIAEEDLKLRGPGEVIGLRQHGFPEVRLLDLTRDRRLIEQSRDVLERALADRKGYEKIFAEVEKVYPLADVGIH